MKKLYLALALVTAYPSVADATTLRFDDLPDGLIFSSYGGLEFSDFGAVRPINGVIYFPSNSGVTHGLVSPQQVAYSDPTTGDQEITLYGGSFTWNDAYFTSSFSNGMTLQINGYATVFLGTPPIYSHTLVLDTTGPQHFLADWIGVSRLEFIASSSAPADTNSSSFVMDNFRFNDVPVSAAPEPAAWLTMVMGLGAVGAMLRAKKRRLSIA